MDSVSNEIKDLRAGSVELKAKRLAAEATRRGLILLTCGTYGNVVRILVPLTVSDAIVDEGLAIMAASLAAIQAS
ncbi:MAG: hypothetical protein GZ093_12545 [Rhodoferax sp.]|nr:hypothetical protein [Rhodoferax sp.]